MEQVLRRITEEINSFEYVIIDFKRTLQIDQCAAVLLTQTTEILKLRQKTLLVAHLPDSCADLFAAGGQNEGGAVQVLQDIDSALEWCEDRLLQRDRPDVFGEQRPFPLAAMDILAGFNHQEIAVIESMVTQIHYPPGAVIIREGDIADSLYLLAAGRVSVYLSIKSGARRQRLGSICPGLAFGELGLLDGGTRSANVIADDQTLCYVLLFAKLQAVAKCHPEIHSKLIFNIGRELCARLRRSDAEIRSLSD